MKVKNMLLLALVALCLAVPASASATENLWYDHDNGIYLGGEAAKKYITPKASLTVTVGMTQYGPCNIELEGHAWNKAGAMGEGSVKLEHEVEPCPTSTLGCTVEKSTVSAMGLTLMTNTNVRFSSISIQWHLKGLCGGPATKTVTGTVDGAFIAPTTNAENKWATKSTVSFTSTPGLTVEGSAATLDGTIEFGTHMTVKP
jgi:hypothetical protein